MDYASLISTHSYEAIELALECQSQQRMRMLISPVSPTLARSHPIEPVWMLRTSEIVDPKLGHLSDTEPGILGCAYA